MSWAAITGSAPSAAAAASAPSAFSAKWRPGLATLYSSGPAGVAAGDGGVVGDHRLGQVPVGAGGFAEGDGAGAQARASASRIGVVAGRRSRWPCRRAGGRRKIAAFSWAMPSMLAKGLQMRGGDGGDHRDMRRGQAGQRRDLAGVVHADLDHREIGLGRQRASVSGTPQWLL
jgi:hypothetical protein